MTEDEKTEMEVLQESYVKLQEELRQACFDRDEARDMHQSLYDEVRNTGRYIGARVDLVAVAALEFYANQDNWWAGCWPQDDVDFENVGVVEQLICMATQNEEGGTLFRADGGNTARIALRNILAIRCMRESSKLEKTTTIRTFDIRTFDTSKQESK